MQIIQLMNNKAINRHLGKRCFLSAFLKIGSEIEVRMVIGRWFHSPGAAKENDLDAAD